MADSGTPARTRQVAAGIGLLALAVSALYGGDVFGVRTQLLGSDVPPPRPAAASRAAEGSAATSAEATRVRSSPWWQEVARLDGDGPDTATVALDEGALQWRAAWTCEGGSLVVSPDSDREPLVEATCPAEGAGFSTSTGPVGLEVEADGPWTLVIEQQVDVPLVEPPLDAMTAADTVAVATGSFYDMDQTGRGEMVVYRLADGGHALRLEEFFVTQNVDLEIHFSPLDAPRTTDEFLGARSEKVADLEITAGSMNFTVPDGVDPGEYRSVVIWCPPLQSAYAAATLAEPR
ncbi:MAG: DM13 domain-containing protein [Egibacteraceae bacterium]